MAWLSGPGQNTNFTVVTPLADDDPDDVPQPDATKARADKTIGTAAILRNDDIS